MPLFLNMNVNVTIELYYIFSKISKFRYWLLFTDAVYIDLLGVPEGRNLRTDFTNIFTYLCDQKNEGNSSDKEMGGGPIGRVFTNIP